MPLGFTSMPLSAAGSSPTGGARPGTVNMWHKDAIGLTGVRLVAAAWPETAPASGGGETVAALPPRLGFR
jgi:hypothetical protein